jgi:hypothetical protein
MPTYIIWHAGSRKRAGRHEDKLLGHLQAADDAEARKLAEQRWPGLPLLVNEHRDQTPRTPKWQRLGSRRRARQFPRPVSS